MSFVTDILAVVSGRGWQRDQNTTRLSTFVDIFLKSHAWSLQLRLSCLYLDHKVESLTIAHAHTVPFSFSIDGAAAEWVWKQVKSLNNPPIMPDHGCLVWIIQREGRSGDWTCFTFSFVCLFSYLRSVILFGSKITAILHF